MIGITDLKTGVFFELDNTPYQVVIASHSKMGRGGAVVKAKVRNLLNGAVLDKTFKGSDQFEEADISRRRGQFLYFDGQDAAFMEDETYEQHQIAIDRIAESKPYLVEGMELDLVIYNGSLIALNLPPKVDLTVTYTEPGIKGDTQGSATKPATMETGLVVQVPLFIKEGDRIKVDTRDGSYEERA